MSGSRQQRGNNARGQIAPTTVPRATMLWQIPSVAGHVAVITMPGYFAPFTQNGVPQFLCVELGEYPVSANPTGDNFQLHYASALPAAFTLRLQPNDAAIQNRFGGGLAGGSEIFGYAPIRPVWLNAAASGPMTAALTVAINPGPWTLTVPNSAAINDSFLVAGDVATVGSAIVTQEDTAPVCTVLTGQLYKLVWTGAAWGVTQII